MINIVDLVNKYVEEGYNEIYANAKVAQDIILNYLFKSEYKDNITIKGGVVMYNLTNDKRRATIDIDIDLIHIYLADDNLYKIFTSHKLRGISIIVDVLNITDLKHQDYKGKRIPIIIRDTFNNEISTKIDVGVHTEYDILQDELYFNSCIDNEKIKLLVNSKEQIFVEKIIPIIKFGSLSTRYKDFYDLYWLIVNGNLNSDEVIKIMNDKIFNHKINNISSIDELIKLIDTILLNKRYLEKLNDRKNNWIEIDSDELRKTLINYLNSIVLIEV
jgi:predicted nucleotidyltransferase component of viral defense system